MVCPQNGDCGLKRVIRCVFNDLPTGGFEIKQTKKCFFVCNLSALGLLVPVCRCSRRRSSARTGRVCSIASWRSRGAAWCSASRGRLCAGAVFFFSSSNVHDCLLFVRVPLGVGASLLCGPCARVSTPLLGGCFAVFRRVCAGVFLLFCQAFARVPFSAHSAFVQVLCSVSVLLCRCCALFQCLCAGAVYV